ncbi:triphosphoribosyl-dephospho-CoA synthase MdcB [Aquincola sp. S2]|uniref:Probable 2-(5''-triphosphoribosyl)-3'-dephosphocoenzyme-A synthase n=1 Tax=Pseudaquabacterium terrae TaxID=2732868 RepID=A0ABX2EQD5_9BURK|nr:triphosphoribosyl-dephospho-CoA synthase MdcB [Aquabacterium terrae]NRF70750.1 triphosphoribosyl-dephospho-CoA synthase MdcB [Aquabacterium terrae]
MVNAQAARAPRTPWTAASPAACAIGRAATLALYDELALSPKPGLVTLTDRGSHDDMDARTFMRSLIALRNYFRTIAALGAARAPFDALERCGIDAEARMLTATGGVNTHRGAIFTIGLLCASAGALVAANRRIDAGRLRAELLERWGDALVARAVRPSHLPGGQAARRLGLRSASAEASLGFPVLFDTAAPALRDALRRGMPADAARLDTLFHVIGVLDDANLAHRGGLEGLRFAQRAAQAFLAAGGSSTSDGLARAQAIGRQFVARRLSPGGAADMLAAACWLQRIGASGSPGRVT